jgi:hypothetical protein
MRGVEKSVEREERACASAAWCLWCVDGRGLQSHRHSNEICWVSMSVTSPTSSASCLRPRLQLTWNGRTVYGQVGEHLTPRARETRHVSRGSKRTVVYEWANDEKLCATTHTHTHTHTHHVSYRVVLMCACSISHTWGSSSTEWRSRPHKSARSSQQSCAACSVAETYVIHAPADS